MSLSCRPAKNFPSDLKWDQLHFGQGGGFSGLVTYYILLEDGRLFQRNLRDSTYSFKTTWPDKFVHQMFENYSSLHLDETDVYQPGDLYYFIEYHAKPDQVHRIVWGRPGFVPDENIVNFYNLLYRSTKSKS
jgi:hypothetical protein